MAMRILTWEKAGRQILWTHRGAAFKEKTMELNGPNLDRKSLETRSKEELIEWVIQGAAWVKELKARVKELEGR